MPRGVYERKPRKAQVVPDGGMDPRVKPEDDRKVSEDEMLKQVQHDNLQGMTGEMLKQVQHDNSVVQDDNLGVQDDNSGFSKEVKQQFFENERQAIAGTIADKSIVASGKREMIDRCWLTADMLGAAIKSVKDAGGDTGCLTAAADAFETGIMQLITAIIKIK